MVVPATVDSVGDEVVTLAGVVTGQLVEILAPLDWTSPISTCAEAVVAAQ